MRISICVLEGEPASSPATQRVEPEIAVAALQRIGETVLAGDMSSIHAQA
jgi:hypothetical protein